VARRRKVQYPSSAGPARAPRAGRPLPDRLEINLDAITGQTGLTIGDRVRIAGTGLYAGEAARIERFVGVIPSAVVRTEAGATRQVRTVDLERISKDG
jgi:hypothetical protein